MNSYFTEQIKLKTVVSKGRNNVDCIGDCVNCPIDKLAHKINPLADIPSVSLALETLGIYSTPSASSCHALMTANNKYVFSLKLKELS